ncbi:MAG TPA: bifunctional isocitrate dehydrogenase kinase/phosphatase [Acidimicrobiia bacterium]|nr:bifunctional isocitrate dehydrogenase kinase/phosphatase [Acidimicrobiia bacterium]
MTVDAGPLSDSRLANLGARLIADAYEGFESRFRIVTRRARIRFAERDWQGMATDAHERLDLYERASQGTAASIRDLLGQRSEDEMVWAGMKAVYSGLIMDRHDWELAETFFNSVTRKIFATVGVDPRIEFVDTDFDSPPSEPVTPLHRSYPSLPIRELVGKVLEEAALGAEFVDLERDAELASQRIAAHLRSIGALRVVDRTEVIDAVFFRGKGAYIIGRLYSGSHVVPLVLAMLHPPEGLVVDAVLLTENQVSILFSFTRSYFHVDVDRPWDLIRFLRTLMPRKRLAELYISLGHNKHGKTALYRELRRHLLTSGDRFILARGAPGLVMVVFTLPGFDVVFKVIKDRFPPQKTTTRSKVKEKYGFVFHHDRAGRLVDAQEFAYLALPLDRFEREVLDQLTAECDRSVDVGSDTVTIRHCYVERRVIPLDLYLRDADPTLAREAIVDYGSAIRELAASGIFPGDLLLKNFGVTRHGRVVFYDYDELSALSEVKFRAVPAARSAEAEMAAEPWFSVGPTDVFPAEFETFLGVKGQIRQAFAAEHDELFGDEWWRSMQQRVDDGELIEIYPYEPRARLAPAPD